MRRSLLAAALFLAASLHGQVTERGDLRSYLNAIRAPRAGSEAFVVPPEEDRIKWKQTVGLLLQGQTARAAEMAAGLGYDLIRFRDEPSGKEYWVLRERAAGFRGQGTYGFNLAACRPLSIQAPHVDFDAGTGPQAVHVFLATDSLALMLAGTHRCASSQPTPCDGLTTVCSGKEERYRISDPAHFTAGFFQATHEVIHDSVPDSTGISLHGFVWKDGDPEAIVSNTACGLLEKSTATELTRQYNLRFERLGLKMRAGSCHEAGGPTRLCAQSNVQGRYTAGSKDPCACAGGKSTCAADSRCAQTMAYPQRFIHIEQSCALRQLANCRRPESVPYEVTAEIIGAMFPCAAAKSPVRRAPPLRPGP